MKKKAPTTIKPALGCSFVPIPHAGIQKRDTGENSDQHTADFERIQNLLMSQFAENGFSVVDAMSLTRGLDIPPQAVEENFQKWTTRLCKSGHLAKTLGSYDYPVFKVLVKV
jgi:hypothetical protein